MSAILHLDDPISDLEAIAIRMSNLDGTRVFDPSRQSRENAAITKELLYIAHLLDEVRVAVMREYHDYKQSAQQRGTHV